MENFSSTTRIEELRVTIDDLFILFTHSNIPSISSLEAYKMKRK